MDTKPVFHGSDIEKICEYYNLKKEDIVNFGANVNPLGLSPHVKEAIADNLDLLSSYPDRNYTALRRVIAGYCNIPADYILPGSGSSELIALLIEVRAPKHTLVLGPTYSEYSRELSFSGSAPDISAVTAIPFTRTYPNLMVLRGVSKFFAAPGMRLGYGVTGNRAFLEKMKEKQIPWSLNSIGAFAGEIMFQDQEYISRTRSLILSERDRMYREIEKLPAFKSYFPYANFLLLKIQKPDVTSFDVFELCIKNNLMIRDCSSFQCLDGEFIRFCIMMPEDNSRLLEVLRTV